MQPSRELIIFAAIAVLALAAAGWLIYSRSRRGEDPEAQRRAHVDANGRLIEGMVMDYADAVVYYKWSWRGVDYEASQDLSAFPERLPQGEIIGPVSVKFLSTLPSNSIVMSEKWSGFSPRLSGGTQAMRPADGSP